MEHAVSSVPRSRRGLLRRLIILCALVLVVAACGNDETGLTSAPRPAPGTAPADPSPSQVAHYFGSIPTELPESWRGTTSDQSAVAFFDGALPGTFEAGWHWTLVFESCENGATDVAARVVLFDMGLAIPADVTRPYCEWEIAVDHLAVGTEARSTVAEEGGTFTIRLGDLEVTSVATFSRDGERYATSATTRATADLVVDADGFTGRGSFPFGGLEPSPAFILRGDRTDAAYTFPSAAIGNGG